MDRLRQLKVVVAVEEEGSLVAAGRKLNLSLPSISRILGELEQSLGVVLFERSARRCRATEAGRVLVHRARHLLADYDEILQVVGGRWNEPQGQIRMTAPLTFGRMHVLPAVCHFLKEHPLIDVGLELSDGIIDLQAEDFDLGVRIGPVDAPSLIAKRIGYVHWWALASPSYLSRHGVPQEPNDLSRHHWIQHSSLRSPGPLSLHGSSPRVLDMRLIVNDATSALEAARVDLGITSALSYQAAEDVAEGKLVRVLVDFEPEPLPVSLVYPETRRTVQRLRRLVDFLTKELRKVL
ncbi:LysR family transcriptional regulator [Shinella sp. HZN7]|uniref:LysR family transcriptional regulator n=1 Tax=Shinella sp. (strain HZN7) TaxID=879274 RepID=UPI0007DA885B|nr:LysR family transcriptional regulator [Shinella sp. HZN7]ANH08159.1 hypothetical protein shn_28990 [Shinella sp. HZN7]